ncbi:MAG: MoxR family ATPase [Actinomyces sp.]|jgi:MoxR-like ATPase|nr:MoxR family ATPase [Actinomyces sp.]MCI1642277.1 MoxR family ATPase [Actinomyces sp.]MCI1662791.1 MoxR family ATPase [Actinomyces sp.]MCI1691394.1 MoxR family ATPase [Actinomyces sp.]MCI1788136.1 MoxR family ATPase [Actinomyces sp.]MCI1830283.1 MoxR family ATPase [Actinomyces sp.]
MGDMTAPEVAAIAGRIRASVATVISGKPEAIDAAVCALLAGGHMLIEDVPGVGKTTLARALARSIDARATRIQFTSDMLPTDVTGVSVFDRSTQEFRFHPGPVFTHVLIGDEVNRATPKTQSALLEAMGERQVSIDGSTLPLPDPFMVVATQNPQDMEGTFPLPEAQRDRFMIRLSLGYPEPRAELAMLRARSTAAGASDPLDAVAPVASVDDILRARACVAGIAMADGVAGYLVSLIGATRAHPGIALGASPRATLHLAAMARARAGVLGRSFVSPDDIAALAGVVLPHRLVPRGRHASSLDALAAAAETVSEILGRLPVPGLA